MSSIIRIRAQPVCDGSHLMANKFAEFRNVLSARRRLEHPAVFGHGLPEPPGLVMGEAALDGGGAALNHSAT